MRKTRRIYIFNNYTYIHIYIINNTYNIYIFARFFFSFAKLYLQNHLNNEFIFFIKSNFLQVESQNSTGVFGKLF